MTSRRAALILVLAILSGLPCCRRPAPDPRPASPIRAGDLLELEVLEAFRPSARFVQTLRVAGDGTVRPPLSTPVRAAGTLPGTLADDILRRYQADGLAGRGGASVRVVHRPRGVPIIRRGDVVSVTLVTTTGLVVDAYDIQKLTRVGDDGNARAPWVGPVRVENRTERQASDDVRAKLREASLADDTDAIVVRVAVGDEIPSGTAVLRPGDRVRAGVRDLFEPNREAVMVMRIAPDGSVRIPVLGLVEIAGLTEPAAEARIAERLRAANLIEVAEVSVLRLTR